MVGLIGLFANGVLIESIFKENLNMHPTGRDRQ
jgi:hypothetical protein